MCVHMYCECMCVWNSCTRVLIHMSVSIRQVSSLISLSLCVRACAYVCVSMFVHVCRCGCVLAVAEVRNQPTVDVSPCYPPCLRQGLCCSPLTPGYLTHNLLELSLASSHLPSCCSSPGLQTCPSTVRIRTHSDPHNSQPSHIPPPSFLRQRVSRS